MARKLTEEERLERNARAARERRAKLTEGERQAVNARRRDQDRERQANRNEEEREQARARRRPDNARRARARYANFNEEQRRAKNAYDRQRYSNRTEEQRDQDRERDRERYVNRTEEDRERYRERDRGYKRASYLRDPDKAKAEAKEKYLKNPEKVKEQSKAWRKNNPERARASRRAYRKKLGEAYKKQAREQARISKVKNPERFLLNSARTRAKKLGLPFDLELSDIHIPELCPVFGIPLQPNQGGKPGPGSPTLDRVVPEKGYVKGNVRVISFRANLLKSSHSLEVFEAMVRYLREAGGSSIPNP